MEMKPSARQMVAVLTAVVFSTAVLAQSEFQKFISAPTGDSLWSFSFHPTADGGGFGAMKLDGAQYAERIIRFNGAGVPQWNKSVHFTAAPASAIAAHAGVLADDGLLLCDRAYWSMVDQDSSVLHQTIAKCDTTGNLLWAKRYAQPVETPAMFYGAKRIDALANGSSIVTNYGLSTVGVGDISHLCIAADGTFLWSTSWPTAFTFCQSLELASAATTDGGLVVAVACGTSSGVIETCKLSSSGSMLWHRTIEVSNAPWKTGLIAMVAGPNGGVLLTGHREAGQLMYNYAIWMDAAGDVYRHRWEPNQRYFKPLLWTDGGIWQTTHWGWTHMDTTGSFVDRTFELLPGWWSAPIWRTRTVNADVFSLDSLWLAGYHREQDTQFGFTEVRPFLIRTALDPLVGCNFIELPNQLINYLEPPDSLVEVFDLPLIVPVAATVVDTAMIVVDHPVNTTYDFCSLVSVQEHQVSTSITLSPIPAMDQIVFEVPFTGGAGGSWTILDLSGRHVIAGPLGIDVRQTVDVSTLSAGTYVLQCLAEGKRSSARFVKQ
ncbi:MAG: T9SS type A sorting domain-containing protein [Flavobacteriales bacterium]|nr:MAG: T9SS type A sorting domain-containing protein [Flavobacteriales bacterium]